MIPQQQQQQSHQQHPQQQQHNHQPPPQQVQQQVRARMQLSGGMRPGSHPLQGGPPPPRMPNGPHQLLPPGMPNGPMQNQMPPNFQGNRSGVKFNAKILNFYYQWKKIYINLRLHAIYSCLNGTSD